MVLIPEEFKTHGSVLVEQVRSVDLCTRWWKSTGEILETNWVDAIVEILTTIVSS